MNLANIPELVASSLIIIWAMSIRRRMLSRRTGEMLTMVSILMVLFFVLKMGKYTFFSEVAVLERYCWYLYYVPLILIPLFLFMASLSLDEGFCEKNWLRSYKLFIPAVFLIIGIITNDIHGFAFSFPTRDMDPRGEYSHGVLYFLAVIWIAAMLILSIAMIVRACRLSASRKLVWVPLLPLILGGVYTAIYVFAGERFLGIGVRLRLTDMFCLMIFLIWEGCIRIGLVMSNSGYEKLFNLMRLRAGIYDEDGTCHYLSGDDSFDPYVENLDPDKRLSSRMISGGCFYWEDDLGTINSLNEDIREINQQLEGENELLRSHNEWLQKLSSAVSQNRLYDELTTKLSPWLHKMKEILNEELSCGGEDGFAKKVALASVYGAYVKRAGNLYILSGASSGNLDYSMDDQDASNESIRLSELYLAITESIEYLKLCGVSGIVFFNDENGSEARFENDRIISAYDSFEKIIEEHIEELSAVMVRLSKDGRMRMELQPGEVIVDVDF